MQKLLITISRNALYSADYEAVKTAVHNANIVTDVTVALEFLYRFFSEEVVLYD